MVCRITVYWVLAWLVLAGPADRERTGRVDEIASEAARFADSAVEVEPARTADDWYLPFQTRDRKALGTVRLVSPFGALRTSYRKGHLHTGTDLAPRKRTARELVHPVAAGAVCSIHLAAPHTTVVVEHRLPDGSTLFTSYKHLAEVLVTPGQQVGPRTPLGRLYTRREAKDLGGSYDHLHLEVRKRFDDHGAASWLTMTRAALEERFLDPLQFLKARLKPLAQPAHEKVPVGKKADQRGM